MKKDLRKFIGAGLLVSVLMALFLSPYASSHPDGLEWVAEMKGFLHLGEGEPVLNAPIPDYAVPGVKNEGLATGLAGLVGTLLVFGIGWGLARLLRRKR